MAVKRKKTVLSWLKDIDDGVNLVTGSRIPDLIARGLELFGDDIGKSKQESAQEVLSHMNSPYAKLGVREDADDFVVKAAYKSLMKKYHPDAGSQPDEKKSQQINDAYAEICQERGIGK